MEAIILAGGAGTRLRSVISNVPKPMAPVLGQPFLKHLMDYWAKQGVDHFILSIGHLADEVIRYFSASHVNYQVSFAQETVPLGTGGAIAHSAQFLKSASNPCFVMNGDTLFLVPLSEVQKGLDQSPADFSLALRRLTVNDRYDGVILGDHQQVLGFGGQSSNLVNGGIYCFSAQLARLMREIKAKKGAFSFEKELLPELVAQGRVVGQEYHSPFLDIGVPEDFQQAAGFVKRYLKP